MTIFGVHMDGAIMDTPQAKLRRAALGAFYGFLMGAAFVFIAGSIDLWLHPDLPLGFDWDLFWSRLPLIALGLTLVGAVTCWWNAAWSGLMGGSAVASAFALIVALYSASEVETGMKVIVLVFILVPIAAMTLPITWIIRWLAERHYRAMQTSWSIVRVLGLVIVAIALGSAGGYFMKMPAREAVVIRHFNGVLQNSREVVAISDLDGIQEHAGKPHKLYSEDSKSSTEGFDMRAVFEDGYIVKCTGVVYPGRDPYLSNCSSEQQGMTP